MKRSILMNLPSATLVATGVFLGRGAQADTTLDFNIIPAGQFHNTAINQTFGDSASVTSDGLVVSGFGTPNINLTWQATGVDARWDYYNDGGSVWSAAQLNESAVGTRHELVFTPNAPQAAAIIKSFNFHPYYDVPKDHYTYRISVVNEGGSVLSGPLTNTFIADGLPAHPVSLSYTGAVGQVIILRLDRINSVLPPGQHVEGAGDSIAVDDIVFAQTPETLFSIGPEVIAVNPADGATVPPGGYVYQAAITNRTTAVVTNTIQLKQNGTPLTPTIVSAAGLTTVSYALAGMLPSGITNKFTLTYGDDGVPAKNYTNEVTHFVFPYTSIQLPPPIVFEDFDTTPEGGLPAGWTAANRNTLRSPASEPGLNLTNLDSAAYTNWTVVETFRFTNIFDVYSSNYNGVVPPLDWMEDYQRVLRANPSNVVDCAVLSQPGSGRMAFANSGYRLDDLGQILFLFSPDFNLTGGSNVHISFHSLWEQNQDSIGALEYSIDQGATWLPVVYMLEESDVFTNPDSSIDSLRTLTNRVVGGFEGIAQWVDGGVTNGGFYGAFIGVASNLWGTLGPYISRRAEEDPVASKRVELYRLPLADNQPTVRLRFVHAGTDSWYWGIDNLGLYSMPGFRISSIARSGTDVIVSWPAAAGVRLQRSTSLTTPSWQDVPGSLGVCSVVVPTTNSAAFFRLSKPN